MKIKQLISCDIYRDGGSLEATWHTDDQKEWSVTLHINSWKDPREIKTYHLYNCKLKEKAAHSRIQKNSPEHQQIIEAIETWASANTLSPEGLQKSRDSLFSLLHLLEELRKGNY